MKDGPTGCSAESVAFATLVLLLTRFGLGCPEDLFKSACGSRHILDEGFPDMDPGGSEGYARSQLCSESYDMIWFGVCTTPDWFQWTSRVIPRAG